MVSWMFIRLAIDIQPRRKVRSVISRYASSGKEYVVSSNARGGDCGASHFFGLVIAAEGVTGQMSLSLEVDCLGVDSGVLGSDGSNTEVSHNPWS